MSRTIPAARVQRALYALTQAAFLATAQQPFDDADLEFFFDLAAGVDELRVDEIEAWPRGKRFAAREVLTQYLLFVSINPHLQFPAGFLEGTTSTTLGGELLRYMARWRVPFPQLLDRARRGL